MGKYTKWLFRLYTSNKLKIEDLYKAREYLDYFDRYKQRLELKDIGQYSSLQSLYLAIRPFMENSRQPTSHKDEIRQIKEGAEKVYEDDKWLIVIPHTQEASCYYGKGTEWCTAANKSYNLFDDYNEEGPLYININKTNNKKYQFHFETESFMDETDAEIAHPIAKTIGLSEGAQKWYLDNVSQSSLIFKKSYHCYVVMMKMMRIFIYHIICSPILINYIMRVNQWEILFFHYLVKNIIMNAKHYFMTTMVYSTILMGK